MGTPTQTPSGDGTLPLTESVCPQCLKTIPASRVREGMNVYLAKTCPDHGVSRSIIWRGPPDYTTWFCKKTPNHPAFTHTVREKGCPLDCGLCPEHRQQTCCVLLEVTARCDLGCPVCFASSGGSAEPDPTLDTIRGWYRLLRESTGTCNIQISGGEPTMRDDLPEIITMGRDLGFAFFQLNTNGLRLASEPGYATRLKEAGLSTVFLQFDGLEDRVYRILRGRGLFRQKQAAIANCAEAGLGVVLVPTLVPGVNTVDIGRIIDYAIRGLPTVRGVHFQPISYFGRYPRKPDDADRYTLPELMRDIEAQTDGLIPLAGFRPSGCEHSLCSFHGDYVLMEDGSVRSLAAPDASRACCDRTDRANPAEKKRNHVARRWSLNTGTGECCASSGGAGSAPSRATGEAATGLDEFLERLRRYSFSVTAMAFQDVWNLDLERLRDCCLHVIGAGSRLVPFCAYNLTDASGDPVHRPSATRATVAAERAITPLEPWIAAKIGGEGRPLDLEALHHYQLERANETLFRVQALSRFYRRLLGADGLVLATLEDLADLPFTTADDLKAAPHDFLCVAQDEVERIVTLLTSGTTGPPKRVFFTAEDQELTRDFFHRGMSTLVDTGDRVLILLPGSLPGSVGDLLKEGLERMGVEGIPHGPVTDPRATLDVMEKERVTALVGIPTQVLRLARMTDAGRRARSAQLRSVLLSTDRVPHALARAIEHIWGCEVYNHYGSTEMGLGGGVDCRARGGYHMREADLFFEIVDPITGRPLPEGESGEVVFTTLTRAAMPLIRYRTGDVSRFIPGPCACGTVLRRMAHVDARVTGIVELPGGGILRQGDLDEALFPLPGLVDFSAEYAQEGICAKLLIRFRPCETVPRLDKAEVLEALGAVPALSADLARGRLSICVSDWDGREGITSGTAKRKIAEARENGR
ncbi:MAG: AMP-binding protein [Thermoleophilia bacterium]|nr:AMP-binding protein [Thermoleophilia bacterium]